MTRERVLIHFHGDIGIGWNVANGTRVLLYDGELPSYRESSSHICKISVHARDEYRCENCPQSHDKCLFVHSLYYTLLFPFCHTILVPLPVRYPSQYCLGVGRGGSLFLSQSEASRTGEYSEGDRASEPRRSSSSRRRLRAFLLRRRGVPAGGRCDDWSRRSESQIR